ncbi:hypothetical protein Tcan_11543 [Toxocara canis]|uniref:C-type lectin domain-containing protein n=1 Tax=Toxocara canis TaxID=6265 RepID=A0A0B2UWA2_TOXCA|nr:hypothetical protein Tcan_11543 [Toxocara canis]
MKMTNALLFVAFLLYGFAIAASDSARKCSSECIQTFESAEEDLRNLLRELKDEFFQIKISNEKSIKRIERKLALMRSATDDAVLECLREKSGTPLIKDTKPKRVAMYELKEILFHAQPDGASKWDDGTAYSKDVWPGFPESMPELTEYSCVNLDLETGKPVIGDCALLYDVVVCEQRCVSLNCLK